MTLLKELRIAQYSHSMRFHLPFFLNVIFHFVINVDSLTGAMCSCGGWHGTRLHCVTLVHATHASSSSVTRPFKHLLTGGPPADQLLLPVPPLILVIASNPASRCSRDNRFQSRRKVNCVFLSLPACDAELRPYIMVCGMSQRELVAAFLRSTGCSANCVSGWIWSEPARSCE